MTDPTATPPEATAPSTPTAAAAQPITEQPKAALPGWYRIDDATERWWNGIGWGPEMRAKTAAKPPKKPGRKVPLWALVVSVVGAALLFFIIGAAGGDGSSSTSADDDQIAELTANNSRLQELVDKIDERESDIAQREEDVQAREDAVSVVEQQAAATTLKDGYTYTVGTTMEAGTYQANATNGTCYWEITVSGSNYSDIVDNDLGTDGVLTVTVSPGQDFTSNRCGDWTKIG